MYFFFRVGNYESICFELIRDYCFEVLFFYMEDSCFGKMFVFLIDYERVNK